MNAIEVPRHATWYRIARALGVTTTKRQDIQRVIGYLGGMSSNDVERSATAPPR